MGGFGLFCLYRLDQTRLIYFFMLASRDFYAVYLFLTRRDGDVSTAKRDWAIAFLSSLLPLLYRGPSQSDTSSLVLLLCNFLAIVGTLISTIALIDLGKSFGVVPAQRGVVKKGIYKIFKHPMYTGYGIAELGMVIINPSNLVIFVLSIGGYIFRARRENKILATSIFQVEGLQ